MTQKELNPTEELVISRGEWDENISWEFSISNTEPQKDLCTAVCCVTTFDGKFVLVRNKRGWEFPAGKIEDGETSSDAVIREVLEETGMVIASPKIFGYKKMTAKNPIARNDLKGFYPFPHSYVVFFYAEATKIVSYRLAEDIKEVSSIMKMPENCYRKVGSIKIY